jgi:hypothetical protein
MYNLLISGNPDEWEGEPCTLEIGRCVNEYTDKEIIKQFGLLDAAACQELMRMPCIFAYETSNRKPPKFGTITNITKRQLLVRVEYEIQAVEPFLTAEQMDSLKFELDISRWELNRTHWAVKDVNLPKELHAIGIKLPSWSRAITKAVDISTHSFDVALSFPGEVRELVEAVASELEGLIGPNSYFYDFNYTSQLARPALDLLLQDIYRNRSKIIVVFLSGDYQNKDWCGIEFRAIRDIIAEREYQRIMFIRTDEGVVDGIFKTDGYVDARKFSAKQLAQFINERATV